MTRQNNIKIGFESLKDKTIKEVKEFTDFIKKETGEDAEFNFNDLDNQEDFKGYSYAEFLAEQYQDELKRFNELQTIKEKGINHNQKVREINKLPYAERLVEDLK
ncbi:MAG: hypothetical protein ACOC56_03945 [Atribacterota bacterium]